jgi:hypothetical protein
MVRYAFTVTDFHRLPFAGLPAHFHSINKRLMRRSKQHRMVHGLSLRYAAIKLTEPGEARQLIMRLSIF